jgi:hypothetical protein
MTRLAIVLTAAGLATGALPVGALAHPGHLPAVGGHDHWELLGGIAVLALAVGVAALARRRT